MKSNLQNILTELNKSLKLLYNERLIHIILFGSYARGDDCYDSDIDVMVVLSDTVDAGKEIERTGELISGISLKYDVLISCIFVSSKRYKIEMSPLMLNVRREGVIL